MLDVKRDFGALGDGRTDDTESIQRAIDACISKGDPKTTSRVAVNSLFMPSGIYKISSPLLVKGVNGFNLRGEGLSSRLLASNKASSVLDLSGVAYSVFSDFSVSGNGSEDLDYGIYLHWNPLETIRGTTTNVFERIQLGGLRCVTGFQIGSIPPISVQTDTTYLSCIDLKGRWSAGSSDRWWKCGLGVGNGAWGNNLVHNVSHIALNNWVVGCRVSASQLCLTGAAFGSNDSDLQLDCQGYFRLAGWRSEGAGRFITTTLGAGTGAAWTIEDGVWVGNSQQKVNWAVFGFGGIMTMRNLVLSSLKYPPIITGAGWTPWVCVLDGVSVQGYGLMDFTSPGSHGRFDVRNFVKVDSVGHVVSVK